jgi:hypothetical protein
MDDRVIDALPARRVFRADPLPPLVVALLFAVFGGGLVWLVEGLVYAQWVCAGIAVFAVIDQVQLHLRPPLEIAAGVATVRPRHGGTFRFDGASLCTITVEGTTTRTLEIRSHGIFGRGVVVTPGLDAGKGATPETFIGPLRDPTAAWHALEQLRRAGGQ